MASETASRFIDALHRLEDQRDVEGLVSLFTDDTEIRHPGHHAVEHGREGARRFWQQYRGSFDDIHSEFHRVVEHDGACFLEWTGRGKVHERDRVEYDGVTVLELGDGHIRAMRTYFDPTQLGWTRSVVK